MRPSGSVLMQTLGHSSESLGERSRSSSLRFDALRLRQGLVELFARLSTQPVREPARGEERSLGTGPHEGKMAECQWLKPALVGQFEFLEWTGDNHLRHSKFVGLREDKKANDVVRE
jgi:ATP-dependent DNA ligase